MLVRSGAIDVVVIDSVAALTPRAEIEGEMGDTHVGLQARLMSQALRKLTANLNKTTTICIFINQLREKIGVMFGSPETTPGGRALKFYSSVRLDIRRIESIKDGVEVVGNRTRVKVVKNKVAPPFRQAEFDIMYGQGISREGAVLDLAVDQGLVKKSGAWYTYEGEQLGQGRENAKRFLIDNAEVMVDIAEKVRAAAGIGVDDEPEDPTGRPSRPAGRRRLAGHPGLNRPCCASGGPAAFGPGPPPGPRREGDGTSSSGVDPALVDSPGDQAVPRAHLRVSDERARLRTDRGPARGRRHGSRHVSTTPTWWCSTPAASGRTPTTSCTERSAI